MLGLVSDETDEVLSAAEERLRAILGREALLRGVFESGETLRGVADLRGDRLLGVIWNRRADGVFPGGVPDPREEGFAPWLVGARRAARDGGTVAFDAVHRVGGAARTFAVQMSPYGESDAASTRFAWSASDVTSQRDAEARRRSSVLAVASAGLSDKAARQLRELLGLAVGFSDLLVAGLGEDDARREHALQIRRAAERAVALLPPFRPVPDAGEVPAFGSDPTPRGSETLLLVVEDDVVRGLLRELLQDLGYTVLSAFGPAIALELATHHPGPIQLLLADVAGAESGGRELAARLRATYPGLRCLFLAEQSPGLIAHEPGTAFLTKPVRRAALARRLREVLGPNA